MPHALETWSNTNSQVLVQWITSLDFKNTMYALPEGSCLVLYPEESCAVVSDEEFLTLGGYERQAPPDLPN